MTPIGQYEVSIESERFHIYPKNKDDETVQVTIDKTFFHLRHKTMGEVTFKRYLYRGQWKWNDSRAKGFCTEDFVLKEVARMLFNRNENQAVKFLIAGITKKQVIVP